MNPIPSPEHRPCALTLLALLALGSVLATACHEDDCLGHDCEPHEQGDTATLDASADTTDDGAAALCQCLLLVCHEDFHARYGEGDDVATPACQADAASFAASALECRQTACNAADCASALGGGSCSAP